MKIKKRYFKAAVRTFAVRQGSYMALPADIVAHLLDVPMEDLPPFTWLNSVNLAAMTVKPRRVSALRAALWELDTND